MCVSCNQGQKSNSFFFIVNFVYLKSAHLMVQFMNNVLNNVYFSKDICFDWSQNCLWFLILHVYFICFWFSEIWYFLTEEGKLYPDGRNIQVMDKETCREAAEQLNMNLGSLGISLHIVPKGCFESEFEHVFQCSFYWKSAKCQTSNLQTYR